MSTPPPPFPGEPPKRMSGLAKVGIGCAALIAIGVIAAALVVPKVVNKVREVAEDPTSMLVWALRQAPEIEVVEHDKEAKVLKVRVLSSGEVLVADYAKLSEGEMIFTNEKGERMTIDPSSGSFAMKPAVDEGELPDNRPDELEVPGPVEQP